jgi:hypothetical protein
MWLLLVGLAAPGETSKSPTWLKDYSQARKQGAAQSKPLAVFLSPGKDGFQKLVREGKLGETSRKVLADSYVCVHIDTTTANGKRLAGAFEMSDGVGLVLSDRSGETQAFRHNGTLSDADLTAHLQSNLPTITRVSSYSPAEAAPRYYPPQSTYYPQTIQGRIQSYGSPSISSGCST